jgi:hypothetical protein
VEKVRLKKDNGPSASILRRGKALRLPGTRRSRSWRSPHGGRRGALFEQVVVVDSRIDRVRNCDEQNDDGNFKDTIFFHSEVPPVSVRRRGGACRGYQFAHASVEGACHRDDAFHVETWVVADKVDVDRRDRLRKLDEFVSILQNHFR